MKLNICQPMGIRNICIFLVALFWLNNRAAKEVPMCVSILEQTTVQLDLFLPFRIHFCCCCWITRPKGAIVLNKMCEISTKLYMRIRVESHEQSHSLPYIHVHWAELIYIYKIFLRMLLTRIESWHSPNAWAQCIRDLSYSLRTGSFCSTNQGAETV